MMYTKSVHAAGLAAILFLTGCGETPELDPVDDGPAQDAIEIKVEKIEPKVGKSEPKPPPASVVLLGSPDLTAGIPGEGKLTVTEIREWLSDAKNHERLQPNLPLGLDTGQSAIKGLKENPLTRAKIELGRQLYFDKRLSADGTVSCASCHDPAHGYAADTQFGVGINGQQGGRNSPVAYNRIVSDLQFWDGRAATLEQQAVGPIENPIEMGNTHEQCVETLGKIEGYRIQFEAIFDDGVTIDNVGQAVASFERVIVTGPSAFDYFDQLQPIEKNYAEDLKDLKTFKEEAPEIVEKYLMLKAGTKKKPMSESAQRGRELFFGDKAGCTACHVGANLADEKYHNLGIGMDKERPDLGRYVVTEEDKDRGAFKTPTIRNIELTAPYMHDGSLKSLEEVVAWYNKGGHPNPHLSDKIKKLNLGDQEKADLVAFMKACTGDFPQVETERLPE